MRRRLFVLGVLLHAAVLIGWVASLESARRRAVTVRLEVVQRDPRDLLRGDYVNLQYKVSNIPVSAFVSPPSPSNWGDRVYVALAPKEGVWEIAAASFSPKGLPLLPGHRLMLGKIGYLGQVVYVTYGIERYYVPEGKANPPRGKIEAEVALTPDGRPFLTGLFVDGRPYP